MPYAILPMILVLVFSLITSGGHAVAFTLRVGPVPLTEDAAAIQETGGTDLPTPRMLNVSVTADGITFGPASTAPKAGIGVPEVRIRRKTPARTANEPSAPLARKISRPRQLQGAEIMLLRQAGQVAKR